MPQPCGASPAKPRSPVLPQSAEARFDGGFTPALRRPGIRPCCTCRRDGGPRRGNSSCITAFIGKLLEKIGVDDPRVITVIDPVADVAAFGKNKYRGEFFLFPASLEFRMTVNYIHSSMETEPLKAELMSIALPKPLIRLFRSSEELRTFLSKR